MPFTRFGRVTEASMVVAADGTPGVHLTFDVPEGVESCDVWLPGIVSSVKILHWIGKNNGDRYTVDSDELTDEIATDWLVGGRVKMADLVRLLAAEPMRSMPTPEPASPEVEKVNAVMQHLHEQGMSLQEIAQTLDVWEGRETDEELR